MAKLIFCKKLKKDMEALDAAPLHGPLGQLILENISKQAWDDWIEYQIKLINEERLDLSEEYAQKRIFECMVEFLNLEDVQEK